MSGFVIFGKRIIPHAEQVTDADIGQDDQASTSSSLYNSTRKKHLDVDTQSRYERANEENSICHQYDWLATPDITNLSPCRCRCCRCQKVGGSYPCVVGFRGVKMCGDCGNGSCDNSLGGCQWRSEWMVCARLTVSRAARKTAI